MKKSEYDVGFGKPPVETRFKKGSSGNPKGRPKGSKNLSTIIQQAAFEKVSIVENGRRRTVPKIQASVMQLVNKAVKGGTKEIQLVFQLLRQEQDDAGLRTGLGPEQEGELFKDLLSRFNEAANDPPTGGQK